MAKLERADHDSTRQPLQTANPQAPPQRPMVHRQPRRSRGRFSLLVYFVVTVTLAFVLSRAAPRLSAVFHHFGIRTSSSSPVGLPPGPRINPPESGPLRGILPLHTQSQSQAAASQFRPDQFPLSKVSSSLRLFCLKLCLLLSHWKSVYLPFSYSRILPVPNCQSTTCSLTRFTTR